MDELTRDLEALRRQLSFPATPDLAGPVGARIRSQPAPRPLRRRLARLPARTPRALAVALVALLILAGGVLAASPAARHAILDLFGLRGATVERTTAPPPRHTRLVLRQREDAHADISSSTLPFVSTPSAATITAAVTKQPAPSANTPI